MFVCFSSTVVGKTTVFQQQFQAALGISGWAGEVWDVNIFKIMWTIGFKSNNKLQHI